MIRAWREAVPMENSTLLHLGDITYRGKDKFHKLADRLTGARKLLILGNHDKQPNEYYEEAGFEIIDPFLMIYGQPRKEISFSHYPYDELGENADHPGQIPPFEWRVHGHIHNNGYGPPPVWPHVPFFYNHINVSVEMLKYRPVRLDVLLNAAIFGELP
jgi:calcineurin-like phosphoesterase family protein